MKNITHELMETYKAYKALIFYQSSGEGRSSSIYVEAMDVDAYGLPRNARTLQPDECRKLAELMNQNPEDRNDFLTSRGIIPAEILQVDTRNCTVIWYSRPKKVRLFFKEELGIPEGEAYVPSLVWKATRQNVSVWAFSGSRKPTTKTALYHAPFFNVDSGGAVCMGTVRVQIDKKTFLEDFTARWEQYFFGSYFTHLLDECPLTCNIVQLWQRLIESGERFPGDVLKSSGRSLRSIMV